MSLSASCESVSQKRTLSCLLAGRVLKKQKPGDGERLQEASLQLLEQQLDLSSLFREVGDSDLCNILKSENKPTTESFPQGFTKLLLVGELRRQAAQLGLSVSVLSVKMLLDRLMEITEEEETKREMLTPSQRARLEVLLKSSTELLSQGVLCPKLLWQELRRDQRIPKLEVVYYLHHYNIVTLKYILESDEEVHSWLVSELKTLCGWTPPQEEVEESKEVQKKALSTVVGMLVGSGFEADRDAVPADRRISLLCCSVLDEMLFWLLDEMDNSQSTGAGNEQWLQIFDASICGASGSPEAVQRFFTHSLTQTLTYKPRLTVSDAISLQSDWTFGKATRLLTQVFRKLALVFSVEEVLRHLQQVLETHEVNWKHVLCFCSTLLVHYSSAQACLRELLSRLLSAAFEGYDLENMITAFLLARQGALEGPTVFTSYSDWFKMCFGGGSGFQASSKKSLVFLLKFLSDLVPFEPPQYLKVHILHPPYVPLKHRNLLMEYVSLAKTRLADLKESVEDMGLYEDVSAGGSSVESQGVQDVRKAVSLFETTGRISATVMEASIFRRPYFLTRFLPALLTPRVLPVKPDARMSFIETLKKADKIPAAQYSSYVEACQKERQQNKTAMCLDTSDDPLQVLEVQLLDFIQMVVNGHDEEMSAQLSRISHTLRLVFPRGRDQLTERQTVLSLQLDSPQNSELHVKVDNLILRSFCQCVLDASQVNPPNKQSLWASRFISTLLANTQLLSSLLHRLWDLFHNQSSSLTPAHILGLGVLLADLHAAASLTPLVQMGPAGSEPVTIVEAVSRALVCKTHRDMVFCVRLCLSSVCYGICRGDSLPQHQQQDYVAHILYKKLLYLIPRLLPETRSQPAGSRLKEDEEESFSKLWCSITEEDSTWRKTALQLWRTTSFKQLEETPQYQLLFSEWLNHELIVQRSEDTLTDAERQEYQQWACSQVYLNLPVERGGCGGDMKTLCSHLLTAIMDHGLRDQTLETQTESERGTSLPDILSRLQEVVFEMEVRSLSRNKAALCDVLFEEISKRCSSTAPLNIGSQLSLQRTLQTWNRVLLSLPPVVFIETKTEGARTALDCNKLIKHINQHQRNICSPAGLMSFHITAHLMRGLLCAAERCGHPADEVNREWTLLSVSCPLLMCSTQHWWQRLSPLLSSMWSRLHDGDSLPEQLQLVSECQIWARSLNEGRLLPTPVAAALQLTSSLHHEGKNQNFRSVLSSLRPDRDDKHKQVFFFLFSFCMKDYLSALLYPQDKNKDRESNFCSELLAMLADSSDWLLLFSSNDLGLYEPLTLLMTDEFTRLMPWAFCSLLLHLKTEVLHRTLRCPGFLYTAVSCYLRVLQLYLEGEAPPASATPSQAQVDSTHILRDTKRFLLRAISQSSPSALSSTNIKQLQPQCADVDPELCAALSLYLDSNSPELDFM